MPPKDGRKVEMAFFPHLLGGHFVPMIDTARIFASRGAKAIIVTTPHNANLYRNAIDRDRAAGHDISFRTLDLPAAEFGLPDGCENQLAISSLDMYTKLFLAVMKLEQPLENLLHDLRPDCLVSDFFHPWSLGVANRVGIPRICFEVSSCFSLCGEDSLRRYTPHASVDSDTEPFLLPGLPDKIEQTKLTLPDWAKAPRSGFTMFLDTVVEAEEKSYGFLFNSFYGLEQTYIDHFSKDMRRKKAWFVGPVSLINKDVEDMTSRGNKVSIDEESVLTWLDSQKPRSVLYVTFGSFPRLAPEQLFEIAHGLEAAGYPFVWVIGKMVKNPEEEGKEDVKWFPEGFEERMKSSNKGFIIKGWAPQLLILQHPAVGGGVCHGGWNSTLEMITNGLPVITWPLTSEQFLNEKFVTEVLRTGISVGNEEWVSWHKPRATVSREKVERAVRRLMGGEEGDEVEEMRMRAREYGKKGKRAVEEGGESYADVEALIEEIRSLRDKNCCNAIN
ncbi:abscisate beta-glucosyltransferase-like [Malania oleifera]|uniref:abscisate beta-glucosyltransferase-like n=1 Tax=Malania oleifera TaxID=397392 RepID=UPI0025AEB38D|nr:abscisate beta-glucosyltransferase-like [Malania oleifera]